MTGTDTAIHEPQTGTLALTGDQIDWTPLQQAALAHIGIDQAPQADQQVFLHIAQRTGLDPFAKQIHMIPRREKQFDSTYRTKWTIQTGIDGFRLIAERHPQYRGQVGPQWCGEDGVWQDVWLHPTKPPVAARVGILRADREGPTWGVAIFREYAQYTTFNNQQQLTRMWREKGAHMCAKCAEALGVRKAFPVELGGVYTEDELAGNGSAAGVPAAAARRVVTAAELTAAPTVVDADPEPPAPAPPTAEAPATEPPVAGPPARMAAGTQKKRIAILTEEAGLDDAGRYEIAGAMVGKTITSTDQLTNREAAAVISGLEKLQGTDDLPTAVAAYLDHYRAQSGVAEAGTSAPESEDQS